MEIELDEVIDKLYLIMHNFILSKVGKDLNQDIIDINLETTINNEIIVNMDLFLELVSFSDHDVEELVREAIKNGITAADQILPNIIINIKQKTK